MLNDRATMSMYLHKWLIVLLRVAYSHYMSLKSLFMVIAVIIVTVVVGKMVVFEL